MNEVYDFIKSNTTEYPKYIGIIQNLLSINDIAWQISEVLFETFTKIAGIIVPNFVGNVGKFAIFFLN
jgi:hypothetical protein